MECDFTKGSETNPLKHLTQMGVDKMKDRYDKPASHLLPPLVLYKC